MSKTIALAATAVVALLAMSACTKSPEPVNAVAGTAPSTSPPATAAGTTEKQGSDSTKPKSGTTQATHSTGTIRSGSDFEFTDAENQCITNAIADNPAVQEIFAGDTENMTPEQAGAAGQLVANCVPKARIADGIVADFKDSSRGRNLTQSDLSCIRDQIISLDTADLGPFIGIFVLAEGSGDTSIAASTISQLNSACGTSIPA